MTRDQACFEARRQLRQFDRFSPPYAVEFGGAAWPERDEAYAAALRVCPRWAAHEDLKAVGLE